MAEIAGNSGSVTYAAGYTTNAHAWRITDGGVVWDRTPFGPTGNARVRAFGVADWSGEYRCWLPGTLNTDLTLAGGFYSTNAHSYSITVTSEDLPTTPFGVDYVTRIAGLNEASGSYACYIDSGVALPQRGSTDTLTLTLDVGLTYSFNILVESVDVGVAADGGEREITVNFQSTGDITEGAVPIISTTGAATFVAQGARQYSGTILVTSIGISMTAERDAAEYTIGFVGDGDLVAA